MPFGLSRKQALVVGGFVLVALLGAVLTFAWEVAAGVTTVLAIQVAVIAVLVILRNQVVSGQQAARAELANAMSGEVARLRAASEELINSTPVRQLLDVVGQDRVATAARLGEMAGEIEAIGKRIDDLARETHKPEAIQTHRSPDAAEADTV
jgi:hypothetical protein